VAVLRLTRRSVGHGHVTIAPYSPNCASASLNCSIYYNFLRELPRIPLLETVRKGCYRRSERGFGRYTESKMVRKELFL
jgi:hypothetical protein